MTVFSDGKQKLLYELEITMSMLSKEASFRNISLGMVMGF